MPHAKLRELIPAPPDQVFALLHDYSRRLTWDTLLSQAYLTDGFTTAGLGAISVCKGKRHLGAIALKTQYIVFQPGQVAAIKMINRPPFFHEFAATIRHSPAPTNSNSSWIEYTFHFTARPKFLRFLLHPIMQRAFQAETQKRLHALKHHFQSQASSHN